MPKNSMSSEDKAVREEKKRDKLIRMKIVYDGLNCEIKTVYPAGTPLKEIKPQHKSLIHDDDLIERR